MNKDKNNLKNIYKQQKIYTKNWLKVRQKINVVILNMLWLRLNF